MKIFSANIENLQGLYISDLKKALGMERMITRVLPLVIENCSDPGLAAAFRKHLVETRGHVNKVEGLLRRLIGETPTETCKIVIGLTTALMDTIRDVTDPYVRDIALVGASQRLEHHEIAVYETLRQWADLLEMYQDAKALRSIEGEEVNAQQLLSDLSGRVNQEAAAA
jgi:ferritin-like metal-binding protein YciE